MAIDITLSRPDETLGGANDITLKAEVITMNIRRDVRNRPTTGNRTFKVDLGRPIRTFTIRCNLHTAQDLDKAQLEALEDAAMNWYAYGSGENKGLLTFTWSTKSGGGYKQYRCFISSIDVREDVVNSPNMYVVTIVLQEAGVMKTSG